MPKPGMGAAFTALVFQRLHRGGDAAAAVDHDRRAELADGHDGSGKSSRTAGNRQG